jgi:hypothetical protein
MENGTAKLNPLLGRFCYNLLVHMPMSFFHILLCLRGEEKRRLRRYVK